ncbi:LysM peptidoglycan-binding domain-containing protein [Veillonella montpellierensis]|uniref:LysM peptidoglycan-binding domain-containing protein n=1 Tax=Veillonella montpellierensis TaxID=187328 RepID=UPI0023F7FE54|nr:LysM peptidoglycan-binding domain-containing protein [Veillonella montpellierensis]
MKRQAKHKHRALIVVMLVLATIFTTGFGMGRRTATPKYETRYDYTVKNGDTLWTIGKEAVGESEDIRDWVRKVQEINGININKEPLYPGQTLVLYRY